MNKPLKINIVILLGMLLVTSGCAGNIKPIVDLDSNAVNNSDFYCLTDDFNIARKCALYSVAEFAGLLQKNGNFDRRTAYSLLFLGTASAVATGFDFNEDVLKSAAVATGSIVGIREITSSDTRREVLQLGIKQMSCAIQAADAVESAANRISAGSFGSLTMSGFISVAGGFKSLADAINKGTADASLVTIANGISADIQSRFTDLPQKYANFEAERAALGIKNEVENLNRIVSAINNANSEAGRFLSTSVIEIRASVTDGLNREISGIDELAKTQQERIDNLLKPVVDAADEEQQQPEIMGSLFINDLAKSFITEVRAKSQEETAGIKSVYENCVKGN